MGTPTLNPPPLTSTFADISGKFSFVWSRWFQLLQQIISGVLHPLAPSGTAQVGAVYQGSGVPANSDGNNGDIYFRTDTPGTVNQRIYVRNTGVWVGIL